MAVYPPDPRIFPRLGSLTLHTRGSVVSVIELDADVTVNVTASVLLEVEADDGLTVKPEVPPAVSQPEKSIETENPRTPIHNSKISFFMD